MQELNFHQYINDKSILVINKRGKVQRIYCPFPVIDSKRKISTVSAVTTGNDNSIYYKIGDHYYQYSFYSILG